MSDEKEKEAGIRPLSWYILNVIGMFFIGGAVGITGEYLERERSHASVGYLYLKPLFV